MLRLGRAAVLVALGFGAPVACGNADLGGGSASLSACPWDPGFGIYNCDQNNWWLEFSVVDTTTATMQVEIAGTDGGPSRFVSLTDIVPDYAQIKFTGDPGDSPVATGALMRLIATRPGPDGGTQTATSGWFAYLKATPAADCGDAAVPDASSADASSADASDAKADAADAKADASDAAADASDATADATVQDAAPDATLDAGASDANGGTDACSGTWNPTWSQTKYAGAWWAEYVVSGGNVPTSVTFQVVGGTSYPLSYAWGKWTGGLNGVPSGTLVLVRAKDGEGNTAQTVQFHYLVDKNPTTDLCQGSPGTVAVAISPKTTSVFTGAKQHFSASVTGTTDTSVSWSIQETTGCGTISSSGDYTAPSNVATCHVVATSGADPSKTDVAAVSVVNTNVASMPHVSVGKPAYASEGTASLLTDGAYRSPNAWTFTPSKCSTTTPCWGAVKVGSGYSRLFVDWSYQDGEGDFDTTVWGGQTLTAYSILVSADSTNGSDGTWTTATDALTSAPVAVTGNTLIQRSHLIQFSGYSWVKLAIASATANEVDELDLWDASTTAGDSYFFHGDSITHRCANMRGTNVNWGEQPSFQADVQAAHAGHYPLQVGGGIISEGSADAAGEIANYLKLFQPVRYWFFTMGTNDLCSGASYFSGYAQKWIDAVKAAGAVPILVHPIWGNNDSSYCYQNGPSFNAAVDSLVSANGLMPAVPLYEATVGHSEYFDSGDVHPNATGCAVWNQTFANAVSGFY
jgi:acyl-CoA thioesterase-1